MAKMRIGGDAEDYMDAPSLGGGDDDSKGGGINIIAAVLDLLGVHQPVAKEPKKSAEGARPGPTGGKAQPSQAIQSPQSGLPPLSVLDDAESAFKPMTPLAQDWGRSYLDSLKPLKAIDPDDGF